MVSVIEFSPNHGPAGTLVKIFGAEFEPAPNQNKVTFDRAKRHTGVAAVIVSATPNVILAKVPVGAATGPVTVTTPRGSATSTAIFTVEVQSPTQGVPTVSVFTPLIGTPGTDVTIRGANFDPTAPNNTVLFNAVARATVSSATASEIVARVPAGAGSGQISVVTPSGTTLSQQEFFIPPAPFTAADVAFTGRVMVGASARAIVLSRPDAFALDLCALVLFDGIAGQRLSLTMTDRTISESDVSIYNPDATTLVSPTYVTDHNGVVVTRLPSLPVDGTYTIVVDPRGTQRGSVTLKLERSDGR